MAEHRHRGQARRIAIVLLLLLGLGACEVIPNGGQVQRPEPVQAPPPRVEEPRLEPRQGPIPVEERNKVAVLVPLSGPNGAVGRSIANAAALAEADTGGEVIKLTTYDTSGGAALAATKAISEGNRLFLGPLLAQDVRAVAPIARQAGIPVITFSNDVDVAGNGAYLMGFSPGQSIERVVEYARSRGVETFAALIPQSDYGRRSGDALMQAVNRSGGRVIALETYDRSPPSLRTAITKLKQQGGFEAVLIADNGRMAATAAQLLKTGSTASARILGTELWKLETNLHATPALRGAWFASVSDTMFNQLRTRYRARYNVTPYRLASLGYDSVLLAVRVGRVWYPNAPFPFRELTTAEGFVGIDGAFRFTPAGVSERALEVQEVGATGLATISPAPRAFEP